MGFTVFTEVMPNPHYENVEDVTPEQVQNALSEITIIDVRENDEWVGELGHIEGSKLINLGNIPAHVDEIPKNQSVVFVCRSGGRSARAASFLKQQGHTHIYNMKGGMILWNQSGLPISKI
jgi:rhodanese-related sulfurtransferase